MSAPAEDPQAAYRAGRQPFMGLLLQVAPGALVPRPETELLGWTAVRLLREQAQGGAGLQMIDMCCGAGNLACGIAAALPELRVFAADLTPSCVELATRNIAQLGLAGRVRAACGDLFTPVREARAAGALSGEADVVVCNPPYISTGRLGGDRAELLLHEPREAFDGGPFGISIHQRVAREAPEFLRPGGWLLFEIGAGQERQVQSVLQRTGGYEQAVVQADGTGVPRVVMARRRGGP